MNMKETLSQMHKYIYVHLWQGFFQDGGGGGYAENSILHVDQV